MKGSVQPSGKFTWHKLGASLSLLCAVHCLATPFIITFLPLAGERFLSNEFVEWGLIGSSAVLASYLLSRDHRKVHRKWQPLFSFALGMSFILSAHLLFPIHKELLSMLGGILIFSGFILNFRHTRHHHSCELHS